MRRTNTGKKKVDEGTSSTKGKKKMTQAEINALARQLEAVESEKERGIDLSEVHDTPIPAKVVEMGWENFIKQTGPINKTWVSLFLAAADHSTFREGVTVRNRKVAFNPRVINRYWGTEDFSRSGEHIMGLPSTFPQDTQLTSTFVADIRAYPCQNWTLESQVNHKELNIPDAFWNIFARHSIVPTQSNQLLSALNSKVIKCIHNGLRFDVGEVACQHMHTVLFSKLFGRLIFPSLITHLCERAGVPVERNDVMEHAGMPMIHKDWLYAIRYRPAQACEVEGIEPPPESRRKRRSRRQGEATGEEEQQQQQGPSASHSEGPSQQFPGQGYFTYSQDQYSNILQRMDGLDANLVGMRAHYDSRLDQQSSHLHRLETKIDTSFAQQQNNFLMLQEQLQNWMSSSHPTHTGQSSAARNQEPTAQEQEDEDEEEDEENEESNDETSSEASDSD